MLAPRKKLWTTPECAYPVIGELLELTENDILVDFGCGKANVLRYLTSSFACRSIGYEVNSERCALALELCEKENVSDKITVLNESALDADFSLPNKVYMFLIDRGLKIMFPLINEAAKNREGGIQVVTSMYSFANIKPEVTKKVVVNKDIKWNLYYYQFPYDDIL